jgi:predicted ATPase/class 3 adenylate cyclase
MMERHVVRIRWGRTLGGIRLLDQAAVAHDAGVRRDLPTGTVTFLFTDVEGSTKLLQELGAQRYAAALAEHRRIVREASAAEGGVEVDTQGDAFFVAFPTAPGALRAVEAIRAGLAGGPIALRMGLHTGTPFVAEEGYIGVDVNRAARIAAVGHGGQVLISAATAALVGPHGLRDLGEHRLKDLSAPERIYQLGDGEFTPLTSLYRTNLPIPATPFVGRDAELGEVGELMRRDDVRLLTLTGPGGTGKTRLALQAAADAADRFPQGVFWVPLAPLRDPGLVAATAAHALGATDGLVDHIADKRLLLILDNFEHLVGAAPELVGLLGSCPNLRLVVTSRELLRLPGEQAYPVPPLEPSDGERLFAARAQAVDPSFVADQAVRELCARLDNLPLALELAAARVRILSPNQLLDRLADRLDALKGGRGADPRQHTLRATIEWSHGLLDNNERQLFARLAVFAGGCMLESAEAVCDADIDTLEALVDKSLVRVRDGGRFWMLETIREFARERLAESGDEERVREQHAAHFLELGEESAPHTLRHDRAWSDRLEAELDNIRAALDHFEERRDWQSVLRLGAALVEFWGGRAHIAEGLQRLETAIAADEQPTAARAKALHAAADLAYGAGAIELSRDRAEAAIELARHLDDVWVEAGAVSVIASIVQSEGDRRRARELWEESARLFRESGDEGNALFEERLVAWMHAELGDRDRAVALYEDTLERARVIGAEYAQAGCLDGLGSEALRERRFEEAAAMFLEAHDLYVGLDDRYRIPISVARFAWVLVDSGHAAEAAQILAAAEAELDRIGARVGWVTVSNDKTRAIAVERLGAQAFAEAWAAGEKLTPDAAAELARETLGRTRGGE